MSQIGDNDSGRIFYFAFEEEKPLKLTWLIKMIESLEINENLIPYSLEGHRHLPEIEQEINQKNTNIPVTFVPQVLPITRGIISCCYVTLKKDLNLKSLEEKQKLVNSILEKFYKNEPFITIINKLGLEVDYCMKNFYWNWRLPCGPLLKLLGIF